MSDGFDFSGLSVERAELPASNAGRPRKYADNPFTAWLKDSKATGEGRAVTVTKAQVKQVEYLLRTSARELGYGVRIVLSGMDGKVFTKETFAAASDNRKVKVAFQATNKRAYTRKADSESADSAE